MIWVGLIIPKLNAFATPLIECQKLFNEHPTCTTKKLGPIAQEVRRVLRFILPVIETDPSIHVRKFLGKLKHLRASHYSDASGFEQESSNPTPGTLGFFSPIPFASWCYKIKWNDLVENLCFTKTDTAILKGPWARPPVANETSIAYMEYSAMALMVLKILLQDLKQRAVGIYRRKWIVLKCDNQNACT